MIILIKNMSRWIYKRSYPEI